MSGAKTQTNIYNKNNCPALSGGWQKNTSSLFYFNLLYQGGTRVTKYLTRRRIELLRKRDRQAASPKNRHTDRFIPAGKSKTTAACQSSTIETQETQGNKKVKPQRPSN